MATSVPLALKGPLWCFMITALIAARSFRWCCGLVALLELDGHRAQPFWSPLRTSFSQL
jgi:hypothetical protein